MIPMTLTMTNPAPGQMLPYCTCRTVYAERDWDGTPDVEALHVLVAGGVPQREASLRLWVPDSSEGMRAALTARIRAYFMAAYPDLNLDCLDGVA